jgi:hypothetical protein
MEEHKGNIVPMYAARVEDLVHAPAIGVTCSCGHISTVAVAFIVKRVGGSTPIKELHHRLRCRECDRRGDCRVDARAALGYDRTTAAT